MKSEGLKSKDFKENERVTLSGYFDVHVHGNGFQLRRNGNFYSIVPVAKKHDLIGVKEIGWEVNNDDHRFDELHKAIEYVLKEEKLSVYVEDVEEYYGKEWSEEED
jgi:hypothetical protein